MKKRSKEELRLAYEKSIQAYQFSVQRHREWMYLYSIICGALLVAFYSVNKDEGQVYSFKVQFSFVLIFLGIVTSVCWILCFIGHYEWTKNFMRIVTINEKRYFDGDVNSKPFVYVGVLTKPGKEKPFYLSGFISTQKVTMVFLYIVLFNWTLAFFDGNNSGLVQCGKFSGVIH